MKAGRYLFGNIYLVTIAFIIAITFIYCAGKDNRPGVADDQKLTNPPDSNVLETYRKQTPFTNPGEFVYLYNNLPESTQAICDLIKKQLIHPQDAREMRNILPEGRAPEDGDMPIVSDMLRVLLQRDSAGLTMKRKAADRLIAACYHHALLLASILREKGYAVRLRAGFARYYEKEVKVRFGHVICEVWDEKNMRWILVDPDRNLYNVSPERFEFPALAWQNFYGTNKRSIRYISSVGEGFQALIHALLLDQAFVISNERSYWHTPEFIFTTDFNLDSLEEGQIQAINDIAMFLSETDIQINKLQELYDKNAFIQEEKRSIMEYYER